MISDIAFDQYQRYKNAQITVDLIRDEKERFKILEVGANEHKNLEKFLKDDEIYYLDKSIPENLLYDERYIKADACSMEFEDESFDIVIALDIFEHIQEQDRKKFLKEINRVSKKAFIIAAPFYSKETDFAEKMLNEIFISYFGEDYIWLLEHIKNGLPKDEIVKSFFMENKIDYYFFSHADIDIWKNIMKAHFKSVESEKTQNFIKTIDRYYNLNIFEEDYFPKNPYRRFFVGLKQKRDKKENLERYFGKKKDITEKNKKNTLEFLLNEFDLLSLREHENKNLNENFSKLTSSKTEILVHVSNVQRDIVQRMENIDSDIYLSKDKTLYAFDKLDKKMENLLSENFGLNQKISEFKEISDRYLNIINENEKKYRDEKSILEKDKEFFRQEYIKQKDEKIGILNEIQALRQMLEKKNFELNEIYTSRGWKYLTKIKRLFGK